MELPIILLETTVLQTGFSANPMINQDLSWEETRVINIGLDLGSSNNRLDCRTRLAFCLIVSPPV